MEIDYETTRTHSPQLLVEGSCYNTKYKYLDQNLTENSFFNINERNNNIISSEKQSKTHMVSENK
jgi:ABC-type enterochelin transport system substrate-binding protein